MHNIWFKAVHVPGVLNDIADSLSRFQIERFRMLAPGVGPYHDTNPGESPHVLAGEVQRLLSVAFCSQY